MKDAELIDLTLSGISRQLASLTADIADLDEIRRSDSTFPQKYGKLEEGLVACVDLMNQIAREIGPDGTIPEEKSP